MSRLLALSNILAILCAITIHASLFEADTIKDSQLKTPNSIDIVVLHIEKIRRPLKTSAVLSKDNYRFSYLTSRTGHLASIMTLSAILPR